MVLLGDLGLIFVKKKYGYANKEVQFLFHFCFTSTVDYSVYSRGFAQVKDHFSCYSFIVL